MTPKTPPPSDGSDQPPRSRPNLGNTAKDSAEMDLWAFDDEEPEGEMSVSKPAKPGIPEPRNPSDGPARGLPPEAVIPSHAQPSGFPEAPSEARESIRVNVNPRSRSSFSSTPKKGLSKEPQKPAERSAPGENFDDLDQWEQPVKVSPAPVKPAPATISPSAFREMPVAPATDPVPDSKQTKIDDAGDEFSIPTRAVGGRAPLKLALNLNLVERIGLASLALLLLAVGVVFYFSTIRQIPSGTGRVDDGDFPVHGEKVEAVSAETYWREPVTSGPTAETVQRETLLIPVVEFTTRGGPAVVRIFFRNEHGDLVGDAVTRTVKGEEKLKIAATAGFDDFGKHAAYRTGQTEPWTIEVLEAAPGNPAPADFKRLFEMNIGTDRR